MKPTDLAYLAGLLDGEGCFYGHLVNKRNKNGGSVELRVTVQACSAPMINRMAEILDSMDVAYSLGPARMLPLSTRPAYKINVQRKAALRILLTALLPYLVVKKAEAEIILRWLNEWPLEMRGRALDNGVQGPTLEDKVILFEHLKAAKRVS